MTSPAGIGAVNTPRAACAQAAAVSIVPQAVRRPTPDRDALPSGWGATEWATRRVVEHAVRERGARAPSVHWHVVLSSELAFRWSGEADLVFIDGDHSEAGCELDWS
jgi:hypothetical protein